MRIIGKCSHTDELRMSCFPAGEFHQFTYFLLKKLQNITQLSCIYHDAKYKHGVNKGMVFNFQQWIQQAIKNPSITVECKISKFE